MPLCTCCSGEKGKGRPEAHNGKNGKGNSVPLNTLLILIYAEVGERGKDRGTMQSVYLCFNDKEEKSTRPR